MSDLVFPQLAGMAWGMLKAPMWSSRVQKSVSGKRQAVGYMSYPLYKYTVSFNVLREYSTHAEVEELQGFFNKLNGQVDTFKFVDPLDASASQQRFGTGNGTQTDFQLARSYGGFTEPVRTPNTITQVRVDGAATTAYTHLGDGVIRFTTAPASGAVIDWSGTFYWRCAFTQDTLDLINTDGVDIWKTNKISFETVKV
jgi:uncharacterized protein (TIGR02217 family)